MNKSTVNEDWHRADIVAAIRKTGTTITALSRKNGFAANSLANVLDRKWPRAEQIIASHLNIPPWVIWPSRYTEEAEFREVKKIFQLFRM